MLYIVYLFFILSSNTNCKLIVFTDPSDIVIVILDQKEGYHMAHAEMLKKNILEQAEALDKVCTIKHIWYI